MEMVPQLTKKIIFDFRKTFDLIDHNILASKLATLNISHDIEYWITALSQTSQTESQFVAPLQIRTERHSSRCPSGK